MKIAYITSEAAPFAKTGGLADVAGSLPQELFNSGCDVKVFLPAYNLINTQLYNLVKIEFSYELKIRVGENLYEVELFEYRKDEYSVPYYFIGNNHFFSRGKIYTDDPDENQRFIFFQKAVVEILQNIKWAPDIVHCNDWQTGLMPVLLRSNYAWDRMFEKTAILFTIHNIGYQGVFGQDTIHFAEIAEELSKPGSPCEFYGNISFMKAGIILSDIINTVSPTYSREILTSEFGWGMEGILKNRKPDLYGILNGADYTEWDPETDTHIPYNFSVDSLGNKLKNKKYLLNKLNMPFKKEIPLIGIVSRIVSQKGFDILSEAVQYLVKLPAQWIILGKGDYRYENKIIKMSRVYPDYIKANLFYNNELAHLIEASSDIFLMPSHYEPCGLNQIYSLKYGTVPVVRRTGGLADTIMDWDEHFYNHQSGNGFVFEGYNGYELYYAVKRSIMCYQNKHLWKKIIKNGMSCDFSWKKSAKEYVELYRKALHKRNL